MDKDNFDLFSISVDDYCINNDIDTYDLFGENLIEEEGDEFTNNIIIPD